MITATGDSNEALVGAKHELGRIVDRRKTREQHASQSEEAVGKTEAELELEAHVAMMAKKVDKLTADAEKAMRELIDYSDELRAQDALITAVLDKASTQQPARPRSLDAEGNTPMPDAEDEETILSPSELLIQEREKYKAAWERRSMLARYANNNDYTNFRQHIHTDDGELAPATEWFTSSGEPRLTRRDPAADISMMPDDEDEELVVTGGVLSLKCPLTLKLFEEPYSNNVCKHTFEKAAILEMMQGATVFYEGGRGRNRGEGVKKLKCPVPGCDKMLEESEFYDDVMVARQVKREKLRLEREEEAGEESDEDGRGKVKRTGSGVNGVNGVKEERVEREMVEMDD